MTQRERTLITLRGGQADRVPIQLFGSMGYSPSMENYGQNYGQFLVYAKQNADMLYGWHEPITTYCSSLYSGIEIKEVVQKDGDRIVVTRAVETPKGTISQVSESDALTTSDQRIRKHFLETDADFDKVMSIPSTPFRPDVGTYHKIRERIGEAGVVTTFLTGPVGISGLLMEPSQFAMWTIDERDRLHALLRKIARQMNDYLDYLIDNDAVELVWFGGAEQVVPPLGSPDMYKEYVDDYERPFVERIHENGGLSILHCHGSIGKVIGQLADTGYDALQPVESPPMGDITMAQAKKTVGERLCLIGNIQVDQMYRSTPEKIEQLVREVIEQGKPNGGFILGISASFFSSDMSDEVLANYMAYIDAGRRYGQY